ncbi:amidase, partial [Klebsiella pneumoniae]|nr:amidase [Klebsiella pneumoniae]
PFSWLGQTGFMARTVSDIAFLMSIAAGPEPGLPAILPEPGSVFDRPQFRLGGQAPDLPGVRIGFSPDLKGLLPVEPEV